MALQTCFPDNIESWIWRIEPQVIKFERLSINVFWGGVNYPRPCPGENMCDYLELVEFNQPYWLQIEPMCMCGKLLYYSSLHVKKRRQWLLTEQRLLDFDVSPGSFQHSVNRYYGNEDYHPNGLPGCTIVFPFDTRSTTSSFIAQASLWELTAGVSDGTFSDFVLFDPDGEPPLCDEFDCSGRDPGWYVSFVLKDSTPDLKPQPALPESKPSI